MSESDPAQDSIDAPAEGNSANARKHGWRAYRPLLSKVALELFVVFVGVSAAFAVQDYRDSRAQHERRQAVYRALDRELKQMAETHGPVFERQASNQLLAWDRALAAGERPSPPAFKLPGAEGPPTGAWDAAVATGSIELVEPELFYELARFYNRANTASLLYQRYSAAAQTDVWPRLGEGPEVFWDGGQPRLTIKAHVQRLRDFHNRAKANSMEARALRAKIQSRLQD